MNVQMLVPNKSKAVKSTAGKLIQTFAICCDKSCFWELLRDLIFDLDFL